MSKFPLLLQVWDYLKTTKKWWLAPALFLLVLLGMLLVFAQGSSFAPLIYTVF